MWQQQQRQVEARVHYIIHALLRSNLDNWKHEGRSIDHLDVRRGGELFSNHIHNTVSKQ